MEDDFHVLALSGGGFKGYFSATVLVELEKSLGYPLANKFDLIAGTSIGGILALALSMEIPTERIATIFIHYGLEIFPQNKTYVQKMVGGLFSPKYSNQGLKKCLKEIFGSARMSDLKHQTIIPAVNYSKGTMQVIKTRHNTKFVADQSKFLIDVALSTSAAPIYFPMHRTEYGDFLDGGLVANHPGLFACIEAKNYLGIEIDKIRQLHIGTLKQKLTSSGDRRQLNIGLAGWGPRLIELFFNCQEQSTEQILKLMLGNRYHSINTEVTEHQAKKVGLDMVSTTSRNILRQQAHMASQAYLGSDHYHVLRKNMAQIFTPKPM